MKFIPKPKAIFVAYIMKIKYECIFLHFRHPISYYASNNTPYYTYPLFFVFFIQQYSWASEEKITPPTVQVDQDSTQKFYLTTKQGKQYIDTFGVYIYINKKYNQYKIITDSTAIWLPDTIKTGDIIEIRAIKIEGE